MRGKPTGLIFLGICIVLAGLLLTHVISARTSGLIFAADLVVLGVASGGFRR